GGRERAPPDRRGGRRPLLRRARQRTPGILLRLTRRARGRADGPAIPSASGQPDVPRARRVRARGRPLLARRGAGGAGPAAPRSGAGAGGVAPPARGGGGGRRAAPPLGDPLRLPSFTPRRRGPRVDGEVLLVDR